MVDLGGGVGFKGICMFFKSTVIKASGQVDKYTDKIDPVFCSYA